MSARQLRCGVLSMQCCQHLLVQKRDKLWCDECSSCGVGCYQCSAVSICLCRSVTNYRVESAAAAVWGVISAALLAFACAEA